MLYGNGVTPVTTDADPLEEWELLPTIPQETFLSPPRRYSLDASSQLCRTTTSDDVIVEPAASGDAAESDTDMWASFVAPERNGDDVALLAKEIVANLRAAAVRSNERVQKLNAAMPSGTTVRRSQLASPSAAAPATLEKNWLETWKRRLFRFELYAMTPLQFVTGILVGVVVGVTVSTQLMRQRPGGGANQLAKRLAACAERHPRASDTRSALRFLPYGALGEADLSSYYVHPTAVEVA